MRFKFRNALVTFRPGELLSDIVLGISSLSCFRQVIVMSSGKPLIRAHCKSSPHSHIILTPGQPILSPLQAVFTMVVYGEILHLLSNPTEILLQSSSKTFKWSRWVWVWLGEKNKTYHRKIQWQSSLKCTLDSTTSWALSAAREKWLNLELDLLGLHIYTYSTSLVVMFKLPIINQSFGVTINSKCSTTVAGARPTWTDVTRKRFQEVLWIRRIK